MEEAETMSIHSRKELRKQKLMEYLKAKGKFKEPNSKSNGQDAFPINKITTSLLKVMGKENKTSERFDNRHKNASVTAQSIVGPAKKVFGVCNKENVKSILQPGCHSSKHSRAENKPSDIAFSKTVKTLNGNFGSRSTSTLSCPVSSRISLGPLVKTKTGLVPAVTQPSQNRGHASVREIGANKCVVNKFTPRDSTSVTASKSSSTLTYKKMLAPVFKSSDEEKKKPVSSMTGAKIKVQGQNRASSNHQLDKSTRPSKSQQSNQQKSTSNLYKYTDTANSHKEKLSKCNKLTTQPTNWSKNPKPELKVGKNGHLHTLQASRAAGVHRTKDEQAQKNRMSSKKDDKVGWGSANVQQQQRRTVVAKPARTVSFPNQTTSTKVKVPDTLIPQTDGKKQTAAQAERMKKLQEWREAKGISYKRPPMPVKPQAKCTAPRLKSFWPTMKDEDEAHSLICAVDRSLADCIQLLREGCPPEQVKAVLTRLPAVSHKFVKYWICQARLMEREGNLDVLPLFEEAVSIVLEPVDELRTVVFEILKRKDEDQAADDKVEGDLPAVENTPEFNKDPVMTPKPVRALICGEKGESSVVKYKITATPGRPPSQQKEPARVNGQEVRFFTPVRRSVRIERASLRYPVSLQEHDRCVSSYNDLISMEDKGRIEEELAGEISPSANSSPMYVYRENEALKDKVFVKLVCEEDAEVYQSKTQALTYF